MDRCICEDTAETSNGTNMPDLMQMLQSTLNKTKEQLLLMESQLDILRKQPSMCGDCATNQMQTEAVIGCIGDQVQDHAVSRIENLSFSRSTVSRQISKLKHDQDYHDVDEKKRKTYFVEDHYKTQGWAQRIARNPLFDTITAGVVFANAIYLGFEAEFYDSFPTPGNVYTGSWIWIVMSQFFCIFFTLELCIRFQAFARKRDSMQDGWFRFDFLLLLFMLVDYWLLLPIESSFTFPFQHLRMLRFIKVCRMADLMRRFPELVTMIEAIGRGLRSMISALILITFCLYVSGFAVHALLQNEDAFNEALYNNYGFSFERLPGTFWCLYIDGVMLLDNTALIMTALLSAGKLNIICAGIIMIILSVLANLLILQMLIALLCVGVINVNVKQREREDIAWLHQRLHDELAECTDVDGKISRRQMSSVLTKPTCRVVLKKLRINTAFFWETASMLHPNEDARVNVKMFLRLLVRCKGDTSISVDVIAAGIGFLNEELLDMERRIVVCMKEKASTGLNSSVFATDCPGLTRSILPPKGSSGSFLQL